jgi:hypothetical protein
MSLPQLTAELSLYRCHGQYLASVHIGLVGSSARAIGRIYPGDDGTTSSGGSEIITVHGTAPVTVPDCGPGFQLQGGQCVPIPTLGTEIITVHGTVPFGGGGAPSKPPTNYGQGPDENKIPQPPFRCDAETVNLNTCWSCTDTPQHGCICTCYDCERNTGKCTTGYVCNDYCNDRRRSLPVGLGLHG